MRILVFSLVIVILLVTIFPLMDNSYAQKYNLEEYERYKIELKNELRGKNAQEIDHNDYINSTDFKKFRENDYSFVRAWNYTMYNLDQKYNDTLPHNWWTGLELYRIGEIDTVAGTYEMEFNYWVQIFEKDDPTNFEAERPEVDFVNMVGDPILIEDAKGIIQKKHYYEDVVSGVFYTKMDFKKFPFEKLNLEIIVEPLYDYTTGYTNSSIQFHRWPYPALELDTPSPGYEIVGYNVTAADYLYSEGDTYSRYIANFEVQREFIGSFLKFIFPILVLSSLAILVMYFPKGEYMTKIELNAIFLLGILFFVQVVVEEIPATGSMTIFDFVVITSYAIMVVAILTPARKWANERSFEKDQEDYEWWEERHEKEISKIESGIQHLELLLLLTKDKKQKQAIEDKMSEFIKKQKEKESIEAKKPDRDKIEKEIKEFGITGEARSLEKWIDLIQDFDDEQLSKDHTNSNKKYNHDGYFAIGGIIVVNFILIMIFTA